ncbi:MAG: hypothetical protein SFX73_39370 [Kofleriaceae bacterium]|nr:hypothetical protein [Kofleriaceae bacterium]
MDHGAAATLRGTLAALACTCGIAQASPSTVMTFEGGAEGDSNVQRVETGPGLETRRISAGVARMGGRLERRGALWGGALSMFGGFLTRVVANPDTSTENVLLLTGDARYLRPIKERSASLGIGVVAADSRPLTDEIGARTFTNLGADGLLVLDGGADRHLTLGFGIRDFTYKPNHDFDWTGPAASARLDYTLWEPSGGTRSLELATYAAFEARSYDATALSSACMPDADPSDECSAGTSLQRRDRSTRIGAEVTYSGRIVAGAGYQLTVIDSNSYGQSLVRHKATLSATTSLPKGIFATGLATLQIDQYPDGLVIKTDNQRSEFTNIDDENRSSLQLRLGKPLSEAWSLEARAAIWRNLGPDAETSFRRASIYAGAIYSR